LLPELFEGSVASEADGDRLQQACLAKKRRLLFVDLQASLDEPELAPRILDGAGEAFDHPPELSFGERGWLGLGGRF
jgi:hypothetical protein